MTTYTVSATRSGAWWAINAAIPQASVHTQSRRLDRVEEAAREAIALALDVPSDSFDVDVEVHLPQEVDDFVHAVNDMTALTDALQSLSLQLRRQVAAQLQALGYSVRDSGQLLGVSAQRISQLLADERYAVDSVFPTADIFVSLDEKLHSARTLIRHVHETAAIA